MSKEKSEKPPNSSDSSSSSEGDDAISDPNTPLQVEPISSYPPIYPYSDPSSITARIHPQTQAFIKSQGPTDFSSVLSLQNQNQPNSSDDLEMQLIISAIENPNQPGIQESSEFRRQIEACKMYENRNQNWHGVQESSNVRRRLDLSEPVFLPAAKKQRISQSSEERDLERAFQISMEETFGKQGRRPSGIVIQENPEPDFDETRTAGAGTQSLVQSDLDREANEWLDRQFEKLEMLRKQERRASGVVIPETPAPEFTETREIGRPESIKGKEKVKEDEKKEEEENPFLLCPSTSEEEDDYNTLKFLVAFRRADGSHLPWSEISFSNFIKEKLPLCPSITEPRCDEKVWKLFDKFIELRARFDGVKRQEGRQYEMFHMGRFVWNWEGGTSSNSNVGPQTHGSDPIAADPGNNVQRGSDAGNGADPNTNMQQGGNAGMEDPGQNVGYPLGNVELGAGYPEALVDTKNGANPRERHGYRLIWEY